MHAIQNALHAIHAVAEKAVVFDHGHHTALLGIFAYAACAFHNHGEPAFKILQGIFAVRAAESAHIVPHARQAQLGGNIHMQANALHFFFQIFAGFAQVS